MYNPYINANPYMSAFQPGQAYMPSQPSYSSMMSQPVQTQRKATAVLYTPLAKDFGSFSLQPGDQALIIAQNEPYMAFKSADEMGRIQTTLYKIEEVTEDAITAPAPEYATKTELAQLQQVVQQIVDNLQPKRSTKKEVVSE